MSDNSEKIQMVPPQEIEAEQAVLGACLIDPENTIPNARLRVEDFYKNAHRDLFEAMLALSQRGEAVDLITLPSYFKHSKHYESVGGASYLAHLVSLVPTAANFRAHESIVIRAAQLRAILRSCQGAQQRAFGKEDPDTIIAECIGILNEVRRHDGTPIVKYGEMVSRGYSAIERRYDLAKAGKIAGLPTGLSELDRVTGGLQPGYYVLAARPSMGKTALAMQIANAVAGHFQKACEALSSDARPVQPTDSVGVLSLEMGEEPIVLRDISRQSKIPLTRILKGTIQDPDWMPLAQAAGALHSLPIFFEFEASTDIRAGRKIDELVQKHGARLIIIDYTQLMKSEEKWGSREQEVSALSRMVKHKVNQHKIPILALSQLNRRLEDRPDKRPMLADLRESGSIEQDADVIMFVYREEMYKPCVCPKDGPCLCERRGKAQLLGRKGRMIGTWDIDLTWRRNTASFHDKDE